ncbi:hypothetical protein GCM10027277_42450 [Pseudoduganella ginsengisoli]|uniref:Uncharacterized protein n=1 Tax=Pseudoduganella ginsengisoli TaxID=1462440 RepID=A0A6L6Q896_9BURK|nr:hypothetical protein [Pseudoduganella ginsengisoli]MTW05815.1 hypothetical protein [Pseudoduganella ginsengisoli]
MANRPVAALPQPHSINRPDFALPGSPLRQKQEQADRDREAQEAAQRHYRETGYLPKEYEIRRAADPEFDRAEREAGKLEFAQAMERLAAWERAWRDIYQYNRIVYHALWSKTWNERVIRGGLPPLKFIYELPKETAKQSVAEYARKHSVSVQRARELLLAERKAAVDRDIAELIRDIVNPAVSPSDTAALVAQFLRKYDVTDRNMIKKLSEYVSAKALWFDRNTPVALSPGPAALKHGEDSPDYVGHRIVGDNFRKEGISIARGKVVLNPGPEHDKKKTETINSIRNAIAGKFSKYYASRLKGSQDHLVVTVDVTDAPWLLELAQQIVREAVQEFRKIDPLGLAQPVEVYFIVGGRSYRVWH